MEWIIGIVVVLLILVPCIRVVNQYERGVVLTLGRYTGMRDPGLRLLVPYIQTMRRVDIRSTPIDVPKQEVITKDNVTVNIDAVVYFRVVDSAKAVLETVNYTYATSQFAQAALRDVAGTAELDELLSNRESMSQKIKEIVDSETAVWGIDVENVKIQNIELPQDMKRAMAKQAEAERERRAKIIAAEGEQMSAEKLGQAADIIAAHPIALQLRNLQTLTEIAVEKNSTIVFPAQLLDTVGNLNNFVKSELKK
jgi:regulator of protease activity HflC (stomatin/prohibitin superfamily)